MEITLKYVLTIFIASGIGYFTGSHFSEKQVVQNVTEYSYIANQEDCIKRGGEYYLRTRGEEIDAYSLNGRTEECIVPNVDYTQNY